MAQETSHDPAVQAETRGRNSTDAVVMKSPRVIRGCRAFAVTALCFAASSNIAHPAEAAPATSIVRVRITDADGHLTAARAWIADAAGQRRFRPSGPATCTPYAPDRSFSCDGDFEMSVPVGANVVHVEKGKEFIPVDRSIDARVGESLDVTIVLERWVNMPARGYYSADLHVHFGHDQREVLEQLSRADDVHLVPAFTFWLRGTEPEWKREWPAWDGGPEQRVDDRHFVTRDNLEIERIAKRDDNGLANGAVFIFHAQQPVSVPRYDARFPADATLAQWAKRTSPDCVIDLDKPTWGEAPVGAALGVYDVAQVCHNHFHRLATLPGGWGMVDRLLPEERSLREPDELFRRTNACYYHWLNCGIRLGVSGGSAMGVMAEPIGFSRTYAKIDGSPTPATLWAAIKAGRTFATSGPMLTLEIDGQEIGSALARRGDATAPLVASLRLQSRENIQALELIENGTVVWRETPAPLAPGKILNHNFTASVRPQRSGWYAARALFLAPDGQLRQAHTSPIYVLIDGKPIASKRSADYMLRWIDRLIETADTPGRYRSDADRDEVLAAYAQARRFYADAADKAARIWHD